MEDKIFKSYSDLISLLSERGIDSLSTDAQYAENILKQVGYYNLINGYSKLFLDNSNHNKYIDGTKIGEINALYQFDRVLRSIFFQYILKVESHIKSLISYSFSEKYGHSNYLLYTNFNTMSKDNPSQITKLISGIQRQIAERCSDPSISHYLRKHGYVPLWVLNNILTLGTVSKFYSLMKQPERQEVSKNFKIMDNELENALRYLSPIRNFCAHGNRLYCYRTKNPLINTRYHSSLNIITDSNGEYSLGKRDLFAAMIVLKRLLSKNDYKRLSKDVNNSLKNLEKKLMILDIDLILKEMGFPRNWCDLIDM